MKIGDEIWGCSRNFYWFLCKFTVSRGERDVRGGKCWRVKGQGALWGEAPGPFLTFQTPPLPFLGSLFFSLLPVKSSAASSYAAKLLLFSRCACRSPRVFIPYIFHDPFVGAAQYVTWLDIISIAGFFLSLPESTLSLLFWNPSPRLLLSRLLYEREWINDDKRRTLVYFFRKFSDTKSVPYYVEWNITEPLWGFSLLRIFPKLLHKIVDRKGLSRV